MPNTTTIPNMILCKRCGTKNKMTTFFSPGGTGTRDFCWCRLCGKILAYFATSNA